MAASASTEFVSPPNAAIGPGEPSALAVAVASNRVVSFRGAVATDRGGDVLDATAEAKSSTWGGVAFASPRPAARSAARAMNAAGEVIQVAAVTRLGGATMCGAAWVCWLFIEARGSAGAAATSVSVLFCEGARPGS